MGPGIGKEQLCGWHYPYNGASSILSVNETSLDIMGVVQSHPQCYTGVFHPIPGLISYAGVTVRWGLLGSAILCYIAHLWVY